MLAELVFGVRRSWVVVVFVLATLLASAATMFGVRLDPNVSALLPEEGQSRALRHYLKDFGGSDLGFILVSAPRALDHPEEQLDTVVADIVRKLKNKQAIQAVSSRMEGKLSADPMTLWRYADKATRQKLAAALEAKAMRTRLRVSRSLLIADPSGATARLVARDPLRLGQIVSEARQGSTASLQPGPAGEIASKDGRSRLILVLPRGQALRSADAKAFVEACESVLRPVRRKHPHWNIALTGGHAIAAATESMLVVDLRNSTLLSLLLAAIMFAISFGRLRAVLAVMPPLLLGSLWTVSLASFLEQGLSAIAIAFMSVVIGVGVDTGVHVYAALLEARKDGMDAESAALRARRETWKPVLVAAAAAAAAFASLGLSSISALRQLGFLCAAGEVLTALAIVVVTPWLGARLERQPPKPNESTQGASWVPWIFRTKKHAVMVLLLLASPLLVVALGHFPKAGGALVALRPKRLKPLQVQDAIYTSFGGRPGQWVVMLRGKDKDALHYRCDMLTESFHRMADSLERIDSISQYVPSPLSQKRRLAARDALDLHKRADELERALDERWTDSNGNEVGFAKERFEAVLKNMRSATQSIVRIDPSDSGNIVLRRYVAASAGQTAIVLYVLPRAGHEARVRAHIAKVDPGAAITGYGQLEQTLRLQLNQELPRVGLLAFLLVAGTLIVSLRRFRDVVLALLVITTQGAMVLACMRLFDVPLHIYNALVLPVLLGITVDEAMFLLFRARRSGSLREVIRHEGLPIRTTALTTAAGFAGLLICDFDGLRHVGMVGALGSLAGLITALLGVPAGLRLAGHKARPASTNQPPA